LSQEPANLRLNQAIIAIEQPIVRAQPLIEMLGFRKRIQEDRKSDRVDGTMPVPNNS